MSKTKPAATATKEPELFGEKPAASTTKKEKAAPAKEGGRAVAVDDPKRRQAAAAAPREKSFLEIVAEATMNPAVDVTKMQALMDMQERIEKKHAKQAWARDFRAMQAELPVIDKDGMIDHGEGKTARGNEKLKARWATFPNLMEICKPIMFRHGFTLSSLVEPSADGVKIDVVSYLDHIDGESRVSRFPMGADVSGGKNNQQGWGSSQQYGMRYNMLALLQIVTKAPADQDNNGFPKQDAKAAGAKKGDTVSSGPERITEAQAMQLREQVEACGVKMADFTKKFRVTVIADLPAEEFKNAMEACTAYKSARDNAQATAR